MLAAKEEARFAPLHAWLKAELQLELTVTGSLVLTHPEAALPRLALALALALAPSPSPSP